MHVHINETRGHNASANIDDLRIAIRIVMLANCDNDSIAYNKIGDYIQMLRWIDDATATQNGCRHGLAHSVNEKIEHRHTYGHSGGNLPRIAPSGIRENAFIELDATIIRTGMQNDRVRRQFCKPLRVKLKIARVLFHGKWHRIETLMLNSK